MVGLLVFHFAFGRLFLYFVLLQCPCLSLFLAEECTNTKWFFVFVLLDIINNRSFENGRKDQVNILCHLRPDEIPQTMEILGMEIRWSARSL